MSNGRSEPSFAAALLFLGLGKSFGGFRLFVADEDIECGSWCEGEDMRTLHGPLSLSSLSRIVPQAASANWACGRRRPLKGELG